MSNTRALMPSRATPAEFWNANAAGYAERQTPMDYKEQRILSVLKRAGDRPLLLDVGCGFGRLVPVLREVQNELPIGGYVGVDCSSELLALARKEYPDWDFREGQIGSLEDVLPEQFDAFVANCVFLLFSDEDLPHVFRDIRSRLRPGAVGVMVFDYGGESYDFTECEAVVLPDHKSATLHSHLPNVVQPLLTEAGFAVTDLFFLCDCHFTIFVEAV